MQPVRLNNRLPDQDSNLEPGGHMYNSSMYTFWRNIYNERGGVFVVVEPKIWAAQGEAVSIRDSHSISENEFSEAINLI